ncbi:MAG: site-2 protease family protein [Chloroflexota bacterium]
MDLQLPTPSDSDIDRYTAIVNRVMRIEDITSGGAKQDYVARYRGRITGDTAAAYDQLAAQFRPLGVTVLFRPDGAEDDPAARHSVYLVPGVNNPAPANPWINLLMFVLTFATVVYTGATTHNVYASPVGLGQTVLGGLPFALGLLAILLAHEFGHYLVGRYYNVQLTLPYFIPFPSFIGTLGAVINMQEVPKNRRTLMDIGIAGPLSGLAVAVPLLFVGLSISNVGLVDTSGLQPGYSYSMEGNSLFYLGAKLLIFGKLLPAPASYGEAGPLLYWVRYFFTGRPFPEGGLDVLIHPLAFAGWIGLLVTAMNLLPVGQLDGGHLVYVLIGRRARKLWPVVMVLLLALGFVSPSWWLWAALIFFLGRRYAEPLDTITPIGPRRKLLAVLGLLIFFLVFIPVPLIIITAP